MNRIIFLLVFLLVLSGCRKETIEGTIITFEASNITASTAFSGGYIRIDNTKALSERGVVWNKIPNMPPDINSDTYKKDNGESIGKAINIGEKYHTKEYYVKMEKLDSKTTYYVRAYAKIKTKYGSDAVIYGEVQDFTTE